MKGQYNTKQYNKKSTLDFKFIKLNELSLINFAPKMSFKTFFSE